MTPSPRFGWGLAPMLTTVMVVIIIGFMSVVTFLDIRRISSIFWDELELRGVQTVGRLNDQLVTSLYYLNLEELESIAGIVSGQPGIERMQVFNAEGRLLVDSRSRYPSEFMVAEFGMRALESQGSLVEKNDGILEVARPIILGEKVLGGVWIGLGSEFLAAQIRGMIIAYIWQASILIAVAVTLSYMVARYATKPIRMLTSVAQDIGGGKLHTQVPVGGAREVRQLGQTLEQMRVELQAFYVRLEQRVEQRTQELATANDELKREITERELAEDRIKASLDEKEVLLREINHRVKNNLQIISSLLNLQSRGIQDEKALRSFEVSQERIRAMALIHEKFYRSDDLAKIDFGEFISSLAADLGNTYGLGQQRIELKIDAEEILLGVDTAIPCGLIVNELVSNSLKHAFQGRERGEISIRLRTEESQHTMVVKDNGVGFPPDFDIAQVDSLGLTIVKALANQMGGQVTLLSKDGANTEVNFPAN